MQRQRGTIPTQSGFMPPPLPQYLSNDSHLSTESSDSQDSIMTQIPMSYHLPPEYVQSYGYVGGAVSSSDSQEFGKFGSMLAPTKRLNPASGSFVPSLPSTSVSSGYPPPLSPAAEPVGKNNAGMTNSLMSRQDAGFKGYQPQRQQIGGLGFQGQVQFPGQAPYPVSGFPSGFQSAYQPIQGYSTSPVEGNGNYAESNTGSPAMGYATMSLGQSYQQMAQNIPIPYGPGTGSGLNPVAYSANNGYGQYLQDHGRAPNAEDNNSRKSSHQNQSRNQRSNFGGAPVVYSIQDARSSTSNPIGGAVQPPQQRTESPPKSSANLSTRPSSAASEAHTSYANELSRGPTPGAQPRLLDLNFSSEPRPAPIDPRSSDSVTPQLRSRRKKSTTSLNANTPNRRDPNNWEVERPASATKEHEYRGRSPPRMMSFMASNVGGTNTLSPITERVSHGGPPRSYNDPFGPTPTMTPYNAGAQIARPVMSSALRNLTNSGTCLPNIEDALNARNLPFVEYCRLQKEEKWGVVKIKNIPYSVNRSEVMAFLGRNAKIIDDANSEPIHIVMERVTSKTLDCYVEFVNLTEAVNAVNRYETNRAGGRSGRLGQRHVDIELSSQEQLMKELFPKAKNVKWVGSRPHIIPKDPADQYNSGFQGFVTKEELVMLVKHVEAPQRSPFSKDCPQRPFECLISTLLKFPWHMVDYITIEDRLLLHKATKELLLLLVERVNNERDPINLTPMLLKRCTRAAIKCLGFTQVMKDDIVFICGLDDVMARELGVAPFAPYWKHLWTIGPRPSAEPDLLMWYIAIIRETTEVRESLSLAEQAARGAPRNEVMLFGNLHKHIHYGSGLLHKTLAEVAKAEWEAIEKILRQALTPTLTEK